MNKKTDILILSDSDEEKEIEFELQAAARPKDWENLKFLEQLHENI